MVRVSGTMDGNDAISQSLSDMTFGPVSSSDQQNDHSFIVLDRMTAEDTDKIQNELATSVRSDNLGNNVGLMSLIFGETPSVTTPTIENAVRSDNLGNNVGLMSFIFGETPSVTTPTIENGVIPHQNSFDLISMPSDVQKRMDSIIRENANLQVTLDQTNLALRQTMMTLSQWRQDMEKVRQDHKEKFQETRSLVLRLKAEKAGMRLEIEKLLQNLEQSHDENMRMTSFFAEAPTVTEIELKSNIDDLQSQLEIIRAARDVELERNTAYVDEISSLKEEISALKGYQKQVDNLQKEVADYKADKTQFEIRHKSVIDELQTLKGENLHLKNDLINLTSVERHSQDYQQAQTKGFTHRIDELTAKLLCTEEELEKTKNELDLMKGQQTSPGSSEEALNQATATVERLRNRIDQMTARVVELEQLCEGHTEEISALKNTNSNQSETVGILTAQVELYQADFLAERASRERLAEQKEQLADDLRRLHRQNLELQNQLPVDEAHTNMTEARDEEVVPAEVEQPTATYRCFVCQNMTSRSLLSFNEHLDRCLGNNDMS